ncbi:MAG TPA: M1 family metallopeptidase, partial [Ferruginibacter sp.]|nr:M1 family metallopeptidase [Ferruginibacter sp.]
VHQDIIKLILPTALAPHATAKIETPFHVKLPNGFSRSGYKGTSFWITQWYPKPAVYDRKGWHPIPYLDQGEFYSEFGSFDVQVKVSKDYMVAATGQFSNAPEISGGTKTLHYKQERVHDFAWFADKNYVLKHDTLRLPSGRIINVNIYHDPKHAKIWANSIAMTKRSILTKSRWVGEYPYDIVSVVDGGNNGGMEYPTITLLESGGSEQSLDFVIDHEVGHNWFYGILASNEREHPWMDEGMNTYYDNRYAQWQYGTAARDVLGIHAKWLRKKMPLDAPHTLLETVIGIKKDQPIETPSEQFNILNYNLVAYTKTGEWMQQLEKELGQPLFDSCMREYYRRWQFKHPYPEDFKAVVEAVSKRNEANQLAELNRKGDLDNKPVKKDIKITGLFNLKETDKHNYISLFPAIGYNYYDKQMVGLLIHNYSLPLPRLQFFAMPFYAAKTKRFNGIGRIGYTLLPGNNGRKIGIAVAGES